MKITFTALLLTIGLTSAYAEQEQSHQTHLVQDAKTRGTCIEVKRCWTAKRDVPVAWMLEGKVVEQKHTCGHECNPDKAPKSH